jgi:ectoine hydroxylase-related dioxygenase (phytanoyl-CoA dioxygenase family)
MSTAPTAATGPERFLRDPAALNMPWVESPFFEFYLEAAKLDPLRERQVREYRRQGYLVVDNLFSAAEIDAVVGRYPWLFDLKTKFNAPPETVEVLTRDPNRRQDAWFVSPEIKHLACHPKVLELLQFLYGRAPFPFQTLDFLCGSQQPLHSDAIHFSCIPARFMCGVWIALEDVHESNGPLMYAEGSHRLDDRQLYELRLWPQDLGGALGANYAQYEDYIRAITRTGDFPVKRLICKKGTALVWASNLLHGGTPITQPGATRKSQVTHYYFEDCIYYTPVYSNPAIGQLYIRDVYDILRERRVPQMLNGAVLPESLLAPMRSHWRPGDKHAPLARPAHAR